MPSSKTCHGLSWFDTKAEKLLFDKQGYACVFAAGPIQRKQMICVGRTSKLPSRLTDLKSAFGGSLKVHHIVWTAGDPLARRIVTEAEGILDKTNRRLSANIFDLTPELAGQVIRIAAEKAGIQTFTHDQMLEEVKAIRHAKIDAALREYDTVRKRGADWDGFKGGVAVDEGRADLDLPLFEG